MRIKKLNPEALKNLVDFFKVLKEINIELKAKKLEETQE